MPGKASGEVILLRRRRQNSQSGYVRPVFGSQRPVSPSASQVPLRGERAAEGCTLGRAWTHWEDKKEPLKAVRWVEQGPAGKTKKSR